MMQVRRTRAGRGRRVAASGAALGLALSLAACSVPNWANPIEWYRDATGVAKNDNTGPEPNQQNLEEGSKEPYPNLATVPQVPTNALSAAEREKLRDSLIADRENAHYVENSDKYSLTPPSMSASATAPRPSETPATGDTTAAAAGADTAPAAVSEPGPPAPAAPATPTVPATPADIAPQAGTPPPPAAAPAEAAATPAPAAEPAPVPAAAPTPTPAPAAAATSAAPTKAAAAPPAKPAARSAQRETPPTESSLASPEVSTLPQGETPGPVPPVPPGVPTASATPPSPQPAPAPASGTAAMTAAATPPAAVARSPQATRGPAAPPLLAALPPSKTTLGTVQFQPNSTSVTEASNEQLREAVQLRQQNGGGVLHVVAFTELGAGRDLATRAIAGFNLALDRARAVGIALTQLGVPAADVTISAGPPPDGRQPGTADISLEK